MLKEEKVTEVIKLYEFFSGRKNIIPKDTDPTETYHWRYAAKFVANMEAHGMSWDSVRKVIPCVIEYMRENGGLSKGLWALTRKDVIDISCTKLKEQEESQQKETQILEQNYAFIKTRNFDLSTCQNEGGYPNIVIWFINKRVSLTYLAMSESCRIAMKQLSDTDRSMLPKQREIERRRVMCFIDKSRLKNIKSVMLDDTINL